MTDPLDALAAQHGGTAAAASAPPPPSSDALDALAAQHGGQLAPTFSATNEKDAAGNAVVDTGIPGAIKGVGEGLTEAGWNPASWVDAISRAYHAVTNPGATARFEWEHPDQTAANANEAERLESLQNANAAFKRGDYKGAAAGFFRSLLYGQGLGPTADKAAQEFANGEHAKALAHIVSFAMGLGAQGYLATPDVVAPAAPAAPTETEALRTFAAKHDFPLDAATATNNRFVRGVQAIADSSLGGSVVAQRAADAQASAIGRIGEDLAAQANGSRAGLSSRSTGAPVSAEGAGEQVRAAVQARIQALDADADAAYRQADQLARGNTRTVQTGVRTTTSPLADAQGRPIITQTPIQQTFETPVDLDPAQRMIKPLYDEWTRQGQVAPLMGAKARAYAAMDRLVHAPRFASLGTADQAASDLGALAGRPEMAELRTAGQSAAARAFSVLRAQVDKAAAAVPGLSDALQAGRVATKEKWETNDLLDDINTEPVKAFNKATTPGDTNIVYLRQLQDAVPNAVPQIARAKLDQFLTRLMTGGDDPLERAKGVLTDWQRLGPATKQLLYGSDPGYLADLNRFFKLASRVVKPANSSRTALTVTQGAELAAHGAGMSALLTGNPFPELAPLGSSLSLAALAKLLHSPMGVKLLTRGLTLPAHSGAAAAWMAQMGTALRSLESSPVPATVGASTNSTAPKP